MKELVKEVNLKVGDIYKNFKTLKTYRVVEIKEEEGKVKLEGIESRNLTTTLKALSTNYYLEVKEEVEASKEEVKTLVEEALEEAGISTKLGKIGDKEEEASISKEEVKEEAKEEIEESGEVKEEVKEVEEESSVNAHNSEEASEELEEELDMEYSLLIDNLMESYPTLNKDLIEEEVLKLMVNLVPNENLEEEVRKVLDSYLNLEEEAKDPIEDSIITLEDLNRGDKVTIVTKDLKVYKGEITFLGELTIKIIDTKESNILKVDIIYIFKEDIDLESLNNFIKDKGIKPEEAKKGNKPNKDKKVTKKDKEEGIITLRDIVEEIVREKLLILDLEYNPNNTFKNIRKKIRKKGNLTKSLRLEGYTYSFRIENKNLIKEELLKILA